MERNFDVSSVEFDREFVGMIALGVDAVAVAVVVARASVLISGVI